MKNALFQNIIADAGQGSETNYHFPNCNVFILYSTMLKEENYKWRTDDRKVMDLNKNLKFALLKNMLKIIK